MAVIVKIYRELELEADESNDIDNKAILTSRIKTFTSRFIEFKQEVQRKFRTVAVLRLSKADNHFYRDLIRGLKPETSRDSHTKLQNAYSKLYHEIHTMVDAPVFSIKNR